VFASINRPGWRVGADEHRGEYAYFLDAGQCAGADWLCKHSSTKFLLRPILYGRRQKLQKRIEPLSHKGHVLR